MSYARSPVATAHLRTCALYHTAAFSPVFRPQSMMWIVSIVVEPADSVGLNKMVLPRAVCSRTMGIKAKCRLKRGRGGLVEGARNRRSPWARALEAMGRAKLGKADQGIHLNKSAAHCCTAGVTLLTPTKTTLRYSTPRALRLSSIYFVIYANY